MQIEDIIYDAAVLKMGVCLERFLKHHPNVSSNDVRSMINEFCMGDDKTRRWMHQIWDERNEVAHPLNERKWKSAHPDERTDAIFNYGRFQKIRQIGLELDKRLKNTTGDHTGMSEIMVSSSLPYDMGNAGDLLKHGALATFVDWFLRYGAKEIRYADPFGGRPWGYIFKDETRRRMEKLESPQMDVGRGGASSMPPQHRKSSLPVIQHAQPHWREYGKYYGSSHVVRNIAEARNKIVHVFASDKDKLARSDLEASGISPIKDHDPENGFGILDKKHDERFDLVLLDPFADLLRNEFGGYRRERPTGHFDSIFQAVERNPELCVVLFVLHVEGDRIATGYAEKRKNIRDFSFSMRCPRIRGTEVDGEDGYDMEILLTSMRFAKKDHSVGALKGCLAELARTLEEVLLLKPGEIEFRHPD